MQIVSQTGAVVDPMSINKAYLDVSAISQAEDIKRRYTRPCRASGMALCSDASMSSA